MTTTVAFPAVLDGVQAFAAAALSIRTVRGYDISGEAGDVAMIGVSDPDPVAGQSAGSFEQSMQTFGGAREEVGVVNGLISAWNGDADQSAATTAACTYLSALGAAIRADKTLGLSTFEYVVAELSAGDITESQNSMGATAVLPFSIDYKIRL